MLRPRAAHPPHQLDRLTEANSSAQFDEDSRQCSFREDLPAESFAPSELQSEAAARYLEPTAALLDDLILAWERYLQVGGFPRAVADVAGGAVDVSGGTARSLWNILTGDVLRVGSMSDRDVKQFIARLVGGLCSPLSLTNIANALDIGSRNTIKDRVDRICVSLYAWRVSVTHDGRTPVKKGQDKLYFVDPLIARLPSLRDNRLAAPDMTQLSEQQVGMALFRAVARVDLEAVLDESALLVRRNPDSGAEIDFVGDLIEVPVEATLEHGTAAGYGTSVKPRCAKSRSNAKASSLPSLAIRANEVAST